MKALRAERPLREHLAFLRDQVGLKDRELALAASVNIATIRRWRKKGEAERNEGLDDLRQIVVILLEGDVMQPRYIGAWLRSRNRVLADQRPLDVLSDPDKFVVAVMAAEAAVSGLMPAKPMDRDDAENSAGIDSGVGGRLAAPIE